MLFIFKCCKALISEGTRLIPLRTYLSGIRAMTSIICINRLNGITLVYC